MQVQGTSRHSIAACIVTAPRQVDGITKFLDNQSFEFDHTFNEDDTTDDVYMYTAQPLVDFVLRGGRATVFACGLC
jgi:kinesin family protein 2/24